MNKTHTEQRIQKLRKLINEHRYAYHVLDQQTLSDAALDSLKHELYMLEQQHPELITPDSPTQRIGGEPLKQFEKVTHRKHMLSMEDVFTYEEFSVWFERVQKLSKTHFSLFCMPKLDGLAITLQYQNGLFSVAATRGNGQIGENVTQNIKTIESIPLQLRPVKEVDLSGMIEIRGEVYFPLKAFSTFNKAQEKKGEKIFVNPRNAAAGSIRQLDSHMTAGRGLAFVAWDLVTDLGQKDMSQKWKLLEEFGFKPAPGAKLCHSLQAVQDHWKDLQEKRNSLDYWIDGMVARVSETEVFDRLGVVGKTPRGLIAWKFPAEEATTVVKQIDWQVGRTGALTPVATFEPTWVGGTTVQHASLHNYDEIQRLDVREGDTVILYKAGDIIPKVKEVLFTLRSKKSLPVVLPKNCPVCGSLIKKQEREVALYCTNTRCFAQDKEAILHAARAFEIDGLGPQIISTLLEAHLISRPSDLFLLRPEELLELEGFADRSAHKLVGEIQSKKQISLAKFIVSLGIRNVGEQTAVDLANHFGDLSALRKTGMEELIKIEQVGEVVAESICQYFEAEHHQHLIDSYLEHGVVVQTQKKSEEKTFFTGKTIVLTGTLEQFSREEAKALIRSKGGHPASSVSAKTDFVLAGSDPGSKYEEARKLGVKILSEAEFSAMLSKK
ncbi:MAG: ligase protein [Candidatus Uhrbacteria bacterium GW2011_GWE2_40_58]|nr:MAG: ligase protein [Candidatus Uhrbacteria bacterium GW2011_GWF2_40_263]KKR67962.1 MAG: ligase protein [Candidatus Uhrbacteria bacterium GW2011_GWE2_40_58]OGL92408.1 MAG: hypothetical protein A2239_02170 [Candidatus Uhrbacteria bacterium RIFOXYA2_FULL_40_9]OGL96999.1 MAG: hypothetical protein A2332_03975 [Candidatus Uhrbacteria bacterium RIFOXYB2_FULL_41_18]HBK34763.1 NAD-dependent DNA ligase LigA [Candidatus Uhrbacteria bacterium]